MRQDSLASGRGWTRVRVNQTGVSSLRVLVTDVDQPEVGLGSGGGLREVRIPGVRATEILQPIVSGHHLAGPICSASA